LNKFTEEAKKEGFENLAVFLGLFGKETLENERAKLWFGFMSLGVYN